MNTNQTISQGKKYDSNLFCCVCFMAGSVLGLFAQTNSK